MTQQTPNQMLNGLNFWAKLFQILENIGVESVAREGSQTYINEAIEQLVKTLQDADDFVANTYKFRGENNMVVEIVFKATVNESDFDVNGEPFDRTGK